MTKLLAFACVTASVLAVGTAAQRGTDFSGSWVLDETQVRSAPDISQRLVVEQPLTTMTNVRGEPMPPAYRTLYVKRYLGDVVQEGTYRIGLIGGTVAGIVPGQPTGGVATRSRGAVIPGVIFSGSIRKATALQGRTSGGAVRPGELMIAAA